MFRKFAFGMALAGMTALANAASATTQVYTDFESKSVYNYTGLGNYITGEVPSTACCGVSLYAQPFVPSVSGNLDHIDIALAYVSGVPAVNISVVADSPYGTNFPGPLGTPLEQFIRLNVPVGGVGVKPMKVRSLIHPGLIAGTTYWIVVTPVGYDTLVAWKWNTVGNAQSYLGGNGPLWSKDPLRDIGGAFDVWTQ